METEAKIVIAFLFNRSGKPELKDSELYLPLSMELGWFTTKEAQEFVKYAIKKELLVKKEGTLHPNFVLETITIPVGFTPTKKTFVEKRSPQKEGSIFDVIIAEISAQTKQNQEETLKEIKKEQQEKNIRPEVAALYIARKHQIDIMEWCDAVEQILVRENTR